MRKVIGATAILFGLAVAAPAVADFKKISKEADFVKVLAGKTLSDTNGGTYVIKADGTMSGKAPNGDKIRGAWKWSGKFWCRNIVVGTRELGTDCQTWEVDGANYRVTRKKGKGQSTNGIIK